MESLEEKNSVVSTELRPLILPEGIPEDELPKVIINILLRRALFEKNPMSKWVLLGALEVLQGRTPKLTATMLSQLVNVSQQSEECKLLSKISMNNQQCNKKEANSIISKSVGIQVDLLDSKKLVDKSSQINIVPTTRDMDVQCEPITQNKEVQCEPSTRTNWAQTLMKPKLVSNWSQTPINHNEKQILTQNVKRDPIQKSKGDVDDSVKHKESNGDAEKYLKHNTGKLDVAENLKHKKSNGDSDNSLKHNKSKEDVVENVKHQKSNGDGDNSSKYNKSKLDVETLKHRNSNGDADNSLNHNKSKGVVEEASKHNKRKEDSENSLKHSKSKDVAVNTSRDAMAAVEQEAFPQKMPIEKPKEEKKERDTPWNFKLVEVDGIPKQRKQVNRLKITTLEVKIPLNAKAKLQDPRLQ